MSPVREGPGSAPRQPWEAWEGGRRGRFDSGPASRNGSTSLPPTQLPCLPIPPSTTALGRSLWLWLFRWLFAGKPSTRCPCSVARRVPGLQARRAQAIGQGFCLWPLRVNSQLCRDPDCEMRPCLTWSELQPQRSQREPNRRPPHAQAVIRESRPFHPSRNNSPPLSSSVTRYLIDSRVLAFSRANRRPRTRRPPGLSALSSSPFLCLLGVLYHQRMIASPIGTDAVLNLASGPLHRSMSVKAPGAGLLLLLRLFIPPKIVHN